LDAILGAALIIRHSYFLLVIPHWNLPEFFIVSALMRALTSVRRGRHLHSQSAYTYLIRVMFKQPQLYTHTPSPYLCQIKYILQDYQWRDQQGSLFHISASSYPCLTSIISYICVIFSLKNLTFWRLPRRQTSLTAS